MSYTLLKQETHIARKNYRCDAYTEIFNRIGMNDLTDEERKIVENFEAKGRRINKGDKYIYTVVVNDSDFCVFRANPEMFKIYNKYEIYEE